MGRVDPALERAWRHGYGVEAFCLAWRPGTTFQVNLDVLGGSVMMTDQPGVRATLAMQVATNPRLWDSLAPLGTLLRPVIRTRAGIDRWDTTFGTFEVEEQSLTYDGAGVMSLTAPDLWSRIINRRLDVPATPSGNAVNWAVAAARQALRGDVTEQFVIASSTTVRDVVYEDDRNGVIQDLLDASNRIGYLDRSGRLVVRDPPRIVGAPVWSVDSFSDGVLISADRSRTSRPVRNRVIVRPTGAARFPQVTVDDDKPLSPTWVGGPMGPRPIIVTNPAVTNAAQARALGEMVKHRTTSLGADISITQAPNWALDPGDLLGVTLPAQNGDGWAYEHHLLATVEHPFPQLGGQGVTQRITTRSTRPDGGDDELVSA